MHALSCIRRTDDTIRTRPTTTEAMLPTKGTSKRDGLVYEETMSCTRVTLKLFRPFCDSSRTNGSISRRAGTPLMALLACVATRSTQTAS
eukprot:2499183-Amphidinium_carterae.2